MTPNEIDRIAAIIAEQVLKKIIAYFDETTKVWQPMEPEQFFHHQIDSFGNIKNSNRKDLLAAQLTDLMIQKEKLLKEEKYELLTELQEIYDKLKKEYDNL